MKSLKIIQVLAKIARVICLILFIVFIVGGVGCLLGIGLYGLAKDLPVQNDQTLEELLLANNIPEAMVYGSMAIGFLSCATYAFLAKHAEIFFKKEIDNGTPFDKKIVKDMRRVAIVHLIVSISVGFTAAITMGIIAALCKVKHSFKVEAFGSIGFAITLLILSLFCDYGAEMKEQNEVTITQKEDIPE